MRGRAERRGRRLLGGLRDRSVNQGIAALRKDSGAGKAETRLGPLVQRGPGGAFREGGNFGNPNRSDSGATARGKEGTAAVTDSLRLDFPEGRLGHCGGTQRFRIMPGPRPGPQPARSEFSTISSHFSLPSTCCAWVTALSCSLNIVSWIWFIAFH